MFFAAYNFAACIQREEQSEYFIVKGITASFIINSLVTLFFQYLGNNSQYYYIILAASAVILGLFLGRIREFSWFQIIIQKLFQRTVANNVFTLIWESAKDGKCLCIRFKLKGDTKSYEGQIDKITSIYQSPTILLKYYIVEDANGNVEKDYSECDCAYMIIKCSEMENIEIAFEE